MRVKLDMVMMMSMYYPSTKATVLLQVLYWHLMHQAEVAEHLPQHGNHCHQRQVCIALELLLNDECPS